MVGQSDELIKVRFSYSNGKSVTLEGASLDAWFTTYQQALLTLQLAIDEAQKPRFTPPVEEANDPEKLRSLRESIIKRDD